MRAFGRVLLRLLQSAALVGAILLIGMIISIVLQFQAVDLTIVAACIALAAAVLDFMRKRSG